MNGKELEQHLESLQGQLRPDELLKVIFDFLSNNPSGEEHELLEIWLMTYSIADPDRVANYWKPQLENGSKVRQYKVARFLCVLARQNQTARKILRDYFETISADEDASLQDLKKHFYEDIDKE